MSDGAACRVASAAHVVSIELADGILVALERILRVFAGDVAACFRNQSVLLCDSLLLLRCILLRLVHCCSQGCCNKRCLRLLVQGCFTKLLQHFRGHATTACQSLEDH